MYIYKGIPGSPGIEKGKVIYWKKDITEKKAVIGIDEAVNKSIEHVDALYKKALNELGDKHAKIFEAYKMLLEDDMLLLPIKQMAQSGTDLIKAVTDVTETMSARLASKDNEYMRQRADDIRYIGQILVSSLCGESDSITDEINLSIEKVIVAARELTPVDTMKFDTSKLAGLVTEKGGAASHTVILAKSLGIPAIVGTGSLDKCNTQKYGFINGYTGEFVYDADSDTEIKYNKLAQDEAAFKQKLAELSTYDAKTKDGRRIKVAINIGKPEDLKDTEQVKFDGVGLFRTEFLYSSCTQKPNIDEQIKAYKQVADKIYPNPVTVRTLDVGGDKTLEYLNMKHEENPFLGNRGIRLCLANKEIFIEQAEAVLTAFANKSVNIMIPLVTSISEIDKTREIFEQAKNNLKSRGADYCTNYKLGIMIETPAAAVMADVFAKHCDFFSIGTNDLVQYVMAADRGNPDVKDVYNPYHPAPLKLIALVINAAHKAGIEVSVCGDLAANTDFTEVLIGMGLEKFSVPYPAVNRIKHRISLTDSIKAANKAQKVLCAENDDEIKKIMEVNE